MTLPLTVNRSAMAVCFNPASSRARFKTKVGIDIAISFFERAMTLRTVARKAFCKFVHNLAERLAESLPGAACDRSTVQTILCALLSAAGRGAELEDWERAG